MTTIRPARPDDALTVRRILDAAMLQTGDVEAAVEHGDVLVAVDDATPDENREDATDGRILGALVLDSTTNPTPGFAEGVTSEAAASTRIAAVAVRRRLRDRGVGTALVEAAFEREGRLTARFDADVLAFYESLGFEIELIADGRYAGALTD